MAIRVHPAEVRGSVPSRQPLVDEIEKAFPTQPPNVKLIPTESQISFYALVKNCDAVAIYNTKMAIEAACMGIPVIVAGEAWIRGIGFSKDANSSEELPALGKPELVMQNTTEKPEWVEAGLAKLGGTETNQIIKETETLLFDNVAYNRMKFATNVYGDGLASARIVAGLTGEKFDEYELVT